MTQSALAPGLGFVEDTDNEEYSDSFTVDEEAAIISENQALLNGEPMTPTTKIDTVLGATRPLRKTVRLTEADEIWGELEDSDTKSVTPSPRPLRRASTTIPPPASGDGAEPNENTSLLRSSTSLSLNARKKRRRSTGFPGFIPRPSPRGPKRRNTQDALGGFWKMRWWRDKRGKGPDPGGDGNAGASGTI